ncbi:MAG: hypothetical protein QXK37_00845 [Candidatus Woesearchaeota archaeon]
MEQLTSNPYIVPECAYAVDANTLFERCPKWNETFKYKLYLSIVKSILIV